jgi:hypothetical protein
LKNNGRACLKVKFQHFPSEIEENHEIHARAPGSLADAQKDYRVSITLTVQNFTNRNFIQGPVKANIVQRSI